MSIILNKLNICRLVTSQLQHRLSSCDANKYTCEGKSVPSPARQEWEPNINKNRCKCKEKSVPPPVHQECEPNTSKSSYIFPSTAKGGCEGKSDPSPARQEWEPNINKNRCIGKSDPSPVRQEYEPTASGNRCEGKSVPSPVRQKWEPNINKNRCIGQPDPSPVRQECQPTVSGNRCEGKSVPSPVRQEWEPNANKNRCEGKSVPSPARQEWEPNINKDRCKGKPVPSPVRQESEPNTSKCGYVFHPTEKGGCEGKSVPSSVRQEPNINKNRCIGKADPSPARKEREPTASGNRRKGKPVPSPVCQESEPNTGKCSYLFHSTAKGGGSEGKSVPAPARQEWEPNINKNRCKGKPVPSPVPKEHEPTESRNRCEEKSVPSPVRQESKPNANKNRCEGTSVPSPARQEWEPNINKNRCEAKSVPSPERQESEPNVNKNRSEGKSVPSPARQEWEPNINKNRCEAKSVPSPERQESEPNVNKNRYEGKSVPSPVRQESEVLANRHSCKLLIVGGGTGGCSVAWRFSRKLKSSHICVIDPSEFHYYQPCFALVAAGIKPFAATHKPLKSVLPPGVRLFKDYAWHFDPACNAVYTHGGNVIRYDFLVVCVGLINDYYKIQGLKPALEDPNSSVSTIYAPEYCCKVWSAIQRTQGGHAIFTYPGLGAKCSGAAQKIMYLTDDYFRQNKTRNLVNITYNTGSDALFGVPKYATALSSVAADRGVAVNTCCELMEVTPKHAVFMDSAGMPIVLPYNFLHVTPPMCPPTSLVQSQLVDETGYLDVDQFSLQHRKYPNVYGLGDCTNTPNSKTAAAVARQSYVVERNLWASMNGEQPAARYDGYGACTIMTSYRTGVLAEFVYNKKPWETFPFDQSKERRLFYYMKRDLFPYLYWNKIIKGRWNGPRRLPRLPYPLQKET